MLRASIHHGPDFAMSLLAVFTSSRETRATETAGAFHPGYVVEGSRRIDVQCAAEQFSTEDF